MFKPKINVVWLKRDIRSKDHLPLCLSELCGLPYLLIYVFEPSQIKRPDTSLRHLSFVYHSLLTLEHRKVELFYGEVESVLGSIVTQCEIQNLFSYQESGVESTWDRDKSVQRFCDAHSIVWKEFQKDGVRRAYKNRDNWDKSWYIQMSTNVIDNAYSSTSAEPLFHNYYKLPVHVQKQLSKWSDEFQPAGELVARKYLSSFIEDRGKNYHRFISKPTESRKSCTRMSPYLAWGNVSIKQVYQAIKNSPQYKENKRAFNGALTRLKWHCHFIQKFEDECRYEYACVNRGYETMAYDRNLHFIQAWKEGKTGYPLVDACMRCLIQTGWINFRMRAMLVSFFCHHLGQDWRDGHYYLASLFLDYEPGIHYTQFQMQAGTTGVNTVRIYNPVKQSLEHDPKCVFIKKWVPELRTVPISLIHKPWEMTLMEQEVYDCVLGKQYPSPIVDLEISGKEARERIWGHRKKMSVQKERKRILNKHVRKK